MAGWMARGMAGWMFGLHGWMDGWMDGWFCLPSSCLFTLRLLLLSHCAFHSLIAAQAFIDLGTFLGPHFWEVLGTEAGILVFSERSFRN